jgi:26S proteasome non-ATPase regulatory subunit 9
MDASTTAAALKQSLQQAGAERDAIEAEIAALSERLNAPGQPGIHGSLLDKEVWQGLLCH